MLKKVLTSAIFLFLFLNESQAGRITGYFEKYGNYNGLTERAHSAGVNWGEILMNDMDSVSSIGKSLLADGVSQGNDYAVSMGKLILGSYLIRSGEIKVGIRYLKESRDFFEEHKDTKSLTQALNEIGVGYLIQQQSKESLTWFTQSLRIGKKAADPTWGFMAEINMARAYIQLNSLDKAIKITHHYKNLAIKYHKYISVGTAYGVLGMIEQIKLNDELALYYYRESIKYNLKSDSKSATASGYNNLAIIYFGLGKTEMALENFQKALVVRKESNNLQGIIESYFNLGGYFFEMKQYDKALINYDLAIEMANANDWLLEKADLYYGKAEVYRAQKSYVKSLEFMEKYSDELVEFNKSNQKDLLSANDFTWKMEHDLLKRKLKMRESYLLGELKTSRIQTGSLFTVGLIITTIGLILRRKYLRRMKVDVG
jgi:tetratricopeptide (TPR) repeat protein